LTFQSRTQDRTWIKDQTGFHKKSAQCQLSRGHQIHFIRPHEPGESQDQLVQGDSDWQRARPSYQVDQGGHTHPQGRSTSHDSRWRQLSTQLHRETQTMCAGCSMDPTNFLPAADPFPGTRDGQNLIIWRWSLPLPTDPVWWRSMHAITSYRGNRPTHTPTHKHLAPTRPPQTGPITIHCAAKLSMHCNYSESSCWWADLLHVSEDVHATTEEVLSLLAVQLIDEFRW